MLKHRLSAFVALIIATGLLLVGGLPASAQDETAPLYFGSQGDLWRTTLSDTQVTQLSEWGYNGGPILSPDGSRLVYLSVASEAVELAEDPANSYILIGSPPTNIWMMETADEDFSRIVNQGNNFPLRRGIPAWSPDSSQLAWVEYSQSLGARLVIYTVSNGTTQVVADGLNLGFQDGGIYVHEVKWGAAGITRHYGTFSESGQFLNIIELYNPNNNSISQFLLSAVDFAESTQLDSPRIVPQEHVWVEHNGQAMIAVLFSDGSWRVIDPANGNQFELADAPSLIASNGNGTVLTPTHTPATSDGGSNIAWQVEHSNGTVTTFNTSAWRLSTPPAISPDGNYVVTNGLGAVDFRRVDGTADGGIIFNPNPEIMRFNDPYSVVWTPMRWVTNVESGDILPTPSVPNPDNNSNTACNAPDRISIGDFATINAGLPNNVRATASITGTYLGVLPAGSFFTIADGPVCANGLRWWQAQTEGGLIGWTAEASADGDLWILPLAGSPLVNTCTLEVRLEAGDTGVVLPSDPNVLRDAPDGNGTNVIGQIPAGSTFRVLGNSLCGSDNRRWFPVQYGNLLGWTAQGEGDTYWIAPAN